MLSPELFFSNQIAALTNALNDNCFIMGDFNLDATMGDRLDYNYKVPMKCLTEFALEKTLTQLVSFSTWSRIINGIKKESLLDHVYVRNFALVTNITFSVPVFGDHVLILVELNVKNSSTFEKVSKRDWSKYNPIEMNNLLLTNLNLCNIDFSKMNVQECWNSIENVIINTVDKLAPIKMYPVNPPRKNPNIPCSIKQKINKRNRLLKHTLDTRHEPQIKLLNRE